MHCARLSVNTHSVFTSNWAVSATYIYCLHTRVLVALFILEVMKETLVSMFLCLCLLLLFLLPYFFFCFFIFIVFPLLFRIYSILLVLLMLIHSYWRMTVYCFPFSQWDVYTYTWMYIELVFPGSFFCSSNCVGDCKNVDTKKKIEQNVR